ncbi:MAG: hypothetical protein M1826_002496 [Phylliscum demangeonii]|nr:MAG: hypothetical protein M1826_002496 [Phylliscum demangeonii]
MERRMDFGADAEFVEDADDYHEGGLPPVTLGETFISPSGVRYKLIHKLGHGTYATVWLASLVDRRGSALCQFRALKFQKATVPNKGMERAVLRHLSRASKHPGRNHVLRLIDHFSIRTVNGEHEVIVTSVLGPTLRQIAGFCCDERTRASGLPPSVMKRVTRELLLALDFLKTMGVVHADLYSENIVATIPSLDGKSEDEVMQLYGHPSPNIVHCYNEIKRGAIGYSVPEVVYEPGSLLDTIVKERKITAEFSVQIIDFGQAFIFDGSRPPKYEYHGFMRTRAPEVLLNHGPDWRYPFAMDIWAMACSLVQVATGTHHLLCVPESCMLEAMEAAIGGALPSFWPGGPRFARSHQELGDLSLEDVLQMGKFYGNDRGFQALLRAMLVLDPANRPSISYRELVEFPVGIQRDSGLDALDCDDEAVRPSSSSPVALYSDRRRRCLDSAEREKNEQRGWFGTTSDLRLMDPVVAALATHLTADGELQICGRTVVRRPRNLSRRQRTKARPRAQESDVAAQLRQDMFERYLLGAGRSLPSWMPPATRPFPNWNGRFSPIDGP